MTNETMLKFKYPETLIREYRYWVVLLRPAQVTAGSLVLASSEEATRFPDLPVEAFAELKTVTGHLETALTDAYGYDRINYLMLMMVDKHVHYHVIPRYSGPVSVNGRELVDNSWPGPPDVTASIELSSAEFTAIQARIREHWPG